MVASLGQTVQSGLLLGLMVGAAALAHHSQRAVDELRFAGQQEALALAEPNGGALRVASMGFHTGLADVMWVRAVLRFVDIEEGKQPEGVRWLRTMLLATAELDPAWRTVYFYGGGMLRVCGDIDGSDELYKRGFEVLPDDAFFPFSVGMNAYLYRDDREAAFTWLEQAASLPGAPAWYGAAASAFLAEEGERQAALAYLNQQLKEETRPAARETLQKRMMRLMHEELAEQLNRRRVEIEAQTGAPLVSLDALGPLPDDPYGQGWVLAPDGEVRSAAREEIEARRARKNERALILRVTASP
jgi:tetratricopeptide (TPR) repeat protein